MKKSVKSNRKKFKKIKKKLICKKINSVKKIKWMKI